MVNNTLTLSPSFARVRLLVGTYVVLTLGTLVALAVLSATAPDQAPSEAWWHAIIVAVFAVLLPLRLRSALRGNLGGLRAVGLIAGVLVLVNAVEASLPVFPGWMRVEMVVVAALMVGVIGFVVKERV